jgi:hypothetical protein
MVKQNKTKQLRFLENGTWIHIKSHDFFTGIVWTLTSFVNWSRNSCYDFLWHLHGRVFFFFFFFFETGFLCMVEVLKVYCTTAQNYFCLIWFIKSSIWLFFFSVLGVDPRVAQVLSNCLLVNCTSVFSCDLLCRTAEWTWTLSSTVCFPPPALGNYRPLQLFCSVMGLDMVEVEERFSLCCPWRVIF